MVEKVLTIFHNVGSAWKLCIFGRSFFESFWVFKYFWIRVDSLYFWAINFELMRCPSNFGSAWNLGIFGRSFFLIFGVSKKPQTSAIYRLPPLHPTGVVPYPVWVVP